jgi:hypothetical protein
MVFFGGIVSRLTPNTHPKISPPLLKVKFRLVGEIPTSELPTTREEIWILALR